jgi:CBS domain-containing protein
MAHQRVADVMTRTVITVAPGTPFREIAWTLNRHGISGAPVVDASGRAIGVVTEADLLRRQAHAGGADRGLRHLLRSLVRAPAGAELTAAELMTSPAVTVHVGDRLPSAAAELARHDIKRAPVLNATGKVVGVLSRKDLLSVYLRSDAELAQEIRTEVLVEAMCLSPSAVEVRVADGVVTLTGRVERQSMIDVVIALTAAVDGVVDVRATLTAEVDDTDLPAPTPENIGVLYPLLHSRPRTEGHHRG